MFALFIQRVPYLCQLPTPHLDNHATRLNLDFISLTI